MRLRRGRISRARYFWATNSLYCACKPISRQARTMCKSPLCSAASISGNRAPRTKQECRHRGSLRDGRIFLPTTRRLLWTTLHDGGQDCQGRRMMNIFSRPDPKSLNWPNSCPTRPATATGTAAPASNRATCSRLRPRMRPESSARPLPHIHLLAGDRENPYIHRDSVCLILY